MTPLHFELDYNQWRCGERAQVNHIDQSLERYSLGEDDTRLVKTLYPAEHNCCCIGLMFLAAGVERDELTCYTASPGPRKYAADFREWPGSAAELVTRLNRRTRRGIELDQEAYRINDDSGGKYRPVAQKMSDLVRLFAEHDVMLTWINVPDSVQEEYLKLCAAAEQ